VSALHEPRVDRDQPGGAVGLRTGRRGDVCPDRAAVSPAGESRGFRGDGNQFPPPRLGFRPVTIHEWPAGLRQVTRTPGGDCASALFDAPGYGRQEGRIARGAADARCAGGRTTRGPRGRDREEGRIARFPSQVQRGKRPGCSFYSASRRAPHRPPPIPVRRRRAGREGGRQNPRSSRAPAQARSKKVKVTRAQGRVAVSPGQRQSRRTVVSMRPGREQRCRRSVRSLPRPRTDVSRDSATALPRTHGCRPTVVVPSASQAPFPRHGSTPAGPGHDCSRPGQMRAAGVHECSRPGPMLTAGVHD
jgi:hypothetical protein